jgi:molybdenum cofactor cytidylyltransferase
MEYKITGIILAAGESTRFGKPKQLIKLNNEFLINRVVREALASNLNPIILILGANFERIHKVINPTERVIIINNENWKLGQSTSLIEGLNHVTKDNSGVMYLLGDQPFITSEVINKLISLYSVSKPNVVMLETNGKRTPPIIFPSSYYHLIRKLEGDKGARNIINDIDVIFLENTDDMLITDIDTENDYKFIKNAHRHNFKKKLL